jgi:hypothetical protein
MPSYRAEHGSMEVTDGDLGLQRFLMTPQGTATQRGKAACSIIESTRTRTPRRSIRHVGDRHRGRQPCHTSKAPIPAMQWAFPCTFCNIRSCCQSIIPPCTFPHNRLHNSHPTHHLFPHREPGHKVPSSSLRVPVSHRVFASRKTAVFFTFVSLSYRVPLLPSWLRCFPGAASRARGVTKIAVRRKPTVSTVRNRPVAGCAFPIRVGIHPPPSVRIPFILFKSRPLVLGCTASAAPKTLGVSVCHCSTTAADLAVTSHPWAVFLISTADSKSRVSRISMSSIIFATFAGDKEAWPTKAFGAHTGMMPPPLD